MTTTRLLRGFTLMETLVMLVLVSFSVLLMFQMLGSYRIARERFVAQAGGIDRQALFDAWFADSVHGLHALESAPLQGTAASFSGWTLNPLFASPGAPVAIEWSLLSGPDGGWSVVYAEAGTQRWALPLADAQEARFVYLDSEGAEHTVWPPAIGLQVALPGAVALVRENGTGERTRVAAVQGPLQPYELPYQLERD